MRIERTLADLRGDRPVGTLWCGPTAVARVSGMTYQNAENAIREAGGARGRVYPETIRSSEWQDLLTSIGITVEGFSQGNTWMIYKGHPTVTQWTRKATPGLWLVRVTNHFAIIEIALTPRGGRRFAIYDNAQQGTPIATKAGRGAIFGARCKLTHAVAL